MHADLPPVPSDPVPAMALALCAGFGGVAAWRDSFVAMANGPPDASSPLALVFEPREGRLVNRWLADASGTDAANVLATALPANAGVFVRSVDWASVYRRYQHAVHAASEPFTAAHGEVGDALVLDVRRAGVFDAATTMLPTASWRDPASVRDWARHLPTDREVIVYCVYGHEVGRATAMQLRARGVNARFLDGGIDAWQHAGLATVPKGATS